MGAPLLALGLGNSLLWSLYLLLTRHVVSGARLDAWAYTLVQLLAAGLVLLWVGRRAARQLGRTAGALDRGLRLPARRHQRRDGRGDHVSRGDAKHPARHGQRADRRGLRLVPDPPGAAAPRLAGAGAAGGGHRGLRGRADQRGVARARLARPVRIDGRRRLVADRLPSAQSLDRSRRAQPLHRRDPGGGVAGADPGLVDAGAGGRHGLALGGRGRRLRQDRALALGRAGRRAVPRARHVARLLDHQPHRRADLPDRAHRHAVLRHRPGGERGLARLGHAAAPVGRANGQRRPSS